MRAGDILLVRADAAALRQFAYDASVECKPLERAKENGNERVSGWEQVKATCKLRISRSLRPSSVRIRCSWGRPRVN